MYKIPNNYYFRLHHIRPRFKNNIENVLLYIATEICLIGEKSEDEFAEELNKSIRCFPGNSLFKIKTINNWRTEISALFGLIEYTEKGKCKQSRLAENLYRRQDLIEFFRFFAYKFQYPGGHLKPSSTLKMINNGVRFKPAKYLLELLFKATESKGRFGLSKAEATHCIFNDLRVIRGYKNVEEVIDLIDTNRKKNIEYDSMGDVIRYAGDILDYLVLADILDLRPNGKYYLKSYELEVVNSIINSNEYFTGYDNLYGKVKLSLADVKKTQVSWYEYVNEGINAKIFKGDISNLIISKEVESDFDPVNNFLQDILTKLNDKTSVSTKEIGDLGEAILIHHEKCRLTLLDRKDLVRKVKKIPEAFAVGYDIHSFEGTGGNKRYIEVKTSTSKNKITVNRFHMTANEWESAETLKEAYFIYRLKISQNSLDLFLIKDPVGQYKSNNLSMTPRNGVDISFTENNGIFEKVLK
jgi:hypothetical protein